MSELLKVQDLLVSLSKEKKILVDRISFSLNSGESLILLGQSGSGKTMTCRAIMDLLDKKRFGVTGSIKFEERELLTANRKEKQGIFGGNIALIPQNPMTALDPSMKVGKQMKETLALHSDAPKSQWRAIVKDALKSAGLEETERIYNSYPHTLSGGMLQRVTIAMALMMNSKLIIADEPTTALDVVHRKYTLETFMKLRKQGAAILMVTHDFAAAIGLGGKLMVMKDGQILEKGSVEKTLVKPQNSYTKALIQASSLSQWDFGEEGFCVSCKTDF